MSASESPTTINLDAMSLDQLSQLKSQQESRLEQLTSQYHQLRAASARLSSAQTALPSVSTSTHIMIPLTESLYAPGSTVDDRILVELGAGFFAEKSSEKAMGVLERKRKLVELNCENVGVAVEASAKNVEAVRGAMQGKLLEIRARQEGRAYRSSGGE